MAFNFKQIADQLRLDSAAKLTEELELWEGQEDMINMFEGDHQNTLVVAKYIEDGNMTMAHETIMEMDTAARDEVGIMVGRSSPEFYDAHFIPEGWVDRKQLLR